MANKPPITRIQIPSNKYRVGRLLPISQISEHHAVGDARHVIDKAQGPVIFSTTYTIAMDGTIYQLVDDKDTPFCDNDFNSNSRAITIEHAGGGNYPYTEAMYQSSIALHRWFFATYGPVNCVRHRDIPEIKADPSKATACPGQLDVERIIKAAKGDDVVIPTKDLFVALYYAYRGSIPTQLEIDRYVGKITYNEMIPILNSGAARNKWITGAEQARDGKLGQPGTTNRDLVIKYIQTNLK